jgi:hypothetical protein
MLLLVVLALLAIFAMLAVAFVVMTGSERITSENLKSIDVQLDPAPKVLDAAAAIVVRGTSVDPNMQLTPASAITWQNLMEKIYGGETIGTLKNPCTLNNSNAQGICNNQLIEFALPQYNPGTDAYGPNVPVDPFHCVGCVLTMLDGPAAGLSTRIVSINPSTHNVQICAFEGGVLPVSGTYQTAHYIVNGFPYSGMGFGYNNSAGTLTPTALLPNSPPSVWASTLGATGGVIPGGVNSDHTAADYQDPLVGLAASDGSGGVIVPIPSMHRADLMAYQAQANNISNPQAWASWKSNLPLLRKIMFRPNPIDNPNFTGSNLNFNPLWDGITNPYDPSSGTGNKWDVDNMGTGRPDSVWVDLGFPVRFTPDGHAYKPLFAILCLDLDGRLNLNAHGSLAQTNANYYLQQSTQRYQPVNVGSNYQPDTQLATSSGSAAYFAGPYGQTITQPPVALPRGQGTGPAEVNLMPLFRNGSGSFDFSSYQYYQYLLSGNTASNPTVMGRYGGPNVGSALPGIESTQFHGSYLTMNNAFPFNGIMGGTYWNNLSSGVWDAYGTPPDYQTIGAEALDTAGRPMYFSMGGPVVNSPYDSDLTRNAAHAVDSALMDDAFSGGEMERILRHSDRDATTLPRRLVDLTLSTTGSILNSRPTEITVESNSVPVSAAVLPPGLRRYLPNYRSVHPVDILYAQVAKNTGKPPQTAAQLAQASIAQLLPWELMEGLKMDINRPFGAGAFSTQQQYRGVLTQGGTQVLSDQPGATNEHLPQFVSTGSTSGTSFNYTADAGVFSKTITSSGTQAINDSLAARQLYARHLYILALSVADIDAIRQNWFGGTTDPEGPDGAMKRMLAQWAVNVVAYRDNNNIMIPFFYDLYPFGGDPTNPNRTPGWQPDYTVQHLVWGCKRPSLLITETFAIHDRRTQDLPDEAVDMRKPGRSSSKPPATKAGYTYDTGDKRDPSFNSRYRPQGSLFVELFNPWPVTEPQLPDLATPVLGPGVELTKVTPATGIGAASPIWRMVIVDPSKLVSQPNAFHPNGDELPDMDNPVIGNRPRSPAVERIVYFAPSSPQTVLPNELSAAVVYTVSNKRTLVVSPGGYAVIGSGDAAQQNRTYIGFAKNSTTGNPTTDRMVDLNATGPNSTVKLPVVKNAGGLAPSGAPVPVLPIDSPRRLSISEPTGGYGKFEALSPKPVTFDPITGKYSSTLDIPVDEWRDPDAIAAGGGNEKGIWKILNNDGTQGAYRIIYLQRLADPTRSFVSETNPNPQSWNPYRTIDAMTVDLTCFNGMTQAKDPTLTPGSPRHFESRQRGEKNAWPLSNAKEMDLWKQEPAAKGNTQPSYKWQGAGWSGGGTPATRMNFPDPLNQSLGYLNVPFVPAGTSPPADPQYPFPLLNWAYRPFNNVYELLLVPTVSSSRLLARNQQSQQNVRQYYGYVDSAVRQATSQGNAYVPPAMYDGSSPSQVPYPHLMNFFESQQSSAPGNTAQLHRLFFYLGVPSRFANTQIQMQAYNAGLNSWSNPTQQYAHWFHTPFNHISRYREPGLINLNTVTSSDVLFGAMDMYPLLWQSTNQANLNPVFWDKFVRSRRGDGATGPATNGSQTLQYMFGIPGITPGLNASKNGIAPSRFMQPYRTPGGASLVPIATNEPAREADVTLLRSDPDVVDPNSTFPKTLRPLYEVDDYLMNTLTSNIGGTPDQFGADVYKPAGLASIDYNRNPNFRYQLLEKLGSTVSPHSNVFAIWITVGYFEALPAPTQGNGQPLMDPTTNQPMYPDGYQLGQELGSDTGDVTRHRAFYIFDRSLPVGYIRGQDVNTQKGFLLQRFIE